MRRRYPLCAPAARAPASREVGLLPPLILFLLALAGGHEALAHEGDALGLTLRSWEERIWNRIADRDGNILGRRDGILQRFDTQQDDEYRLDERADSFLVSEDFLWRQHESGLRFWIGSLNNPDLAIVTEVKKEIPLDTTWLLRFQFFQEGTFEARRNLPIFTFEKRRWLSPGGYAFVSLHPKFEKASVDAEVGGGYRWAPSASLQVSVAALDLFNDAVLALSRSEGFVASEEVEYLREPYALRASASFPLSPRFRIELGGGIVSRSELFMRFPGREADNLRLHRDALFWGGLLEWRPVPWITGGLAHTRERADEERAMEDASRALGARRLVEETRRLSAVLLSRPVRDLQAELWIEWIERPEERRFPNNPAADLDHRDQEVLLSLDLTYQFSRRVDLIGRYLSDDRKAEGIPGLEVSGQNNRLSVRTRLHFTPDTSISLGVNVDLDHGDTLFDGGHLTLLSFW